MKAIWHRQTKTTPGEYKLAAQLVANRLPVWRAKQHEHACFGAIASLVLPFMSVQRSSPGDLCSDQFPYKMFRPLLCRLAPFPLISKAATRQRASRHSRGMWKYCLRQRVLFFSFFFFHLTYSRWTSSLPSCLWSQRIFPSLPGSRLTFFYRDASSALLQLVNQWLNFTYSRSHAFRYERKNTNPTLVRIELTTSVLADVQLTN